MFTPLKDVHCRSYKFIRRVQSNPLTDRKDSIIVHVHGKVVAGPVSAANISLAKGIASERAKVVLSDETSEFAISRLCDCMITDVPHDDDLPPDESELSELSDETEEGFTRTAQIKLNEASRESRAVDDTRGDAEQQEVEIMLRTPSQISTILDSKLSCRSLLS